jgi:TRAP-type C4-dicarboxylate transport system substrate-binding protein
MEIKALETVRKQGTVVTEITPAERNRMREQTKPVAVKYTAEIGEELVKEVNAEIAKVRK